MTRLQQETTIPGWAGALLCARRRAWQIVRMLRQIYFTFELGLRKRRSATSSIQPTWQRVFAIVIIAAALSAPVARASAQDNGKREQGQGKHAQLTAQWWRWILEQPETGNPNFDQTGEDAANAQPQEDVLF